MCGQNRPCCRQAIHDIVDSNHVKVVRPRRNRSYSLRTDGFFVCVYLLTVFIDSQPMNTVTHFNKSSSLRERSLHWVLCKNGKENL